MAENKVILTFTEEEVQNLILSVRTRQAVVKKSGTAEHRRAVEDLKKKLIAAVTPQNEVEE